MIAGSGIAGATCATTESLTPVPFTEVQINDRFWTPRQETNRRVSIAHSFDMLEKAGNIHDLELAASGAREGYKGPVFIDSDLYKALEAAAYSLASYPDPELENRLNGVIAKIAAAQRPDGYLNTWYEVNQPDNRFTNLRDNHELYCAGHLFEAAVAHFFATGKRDLLNVAVKYADYIDSVFGPAPKREGYCGHPEIELALVKLSRATGDEKYFKLAQHFVDMRGSKFFAREHNEDVAKYDGSYLQDNCPIRDHKMIVGHAVRAAYLMSGATDIAARTGDKGLTDMLERVWRDTTSKKMYITGGIGSSAANEGFTTDYDLPNMKAYQETCASIALAMWNYRMALLHRDTKYADVMERSLYNGVLSGVSLDGKRFFYENRLASRGDFHRSDWFGCACCPPNVTRTLASIGGYAYAKSEDSLYVNLYASGHVRTSLGDQKIHLAVTTDYPWDDKVFLHPLVENPTSFSLMLRKPGWCREAKVEVNGERVDAPLSNGYFALSREWKKGDQVTLLFDMPVQRIAAHPGVEQDRGSFAIQRGPLVYCVEAADNAYPVSQLSIPLDSKLKPEYRPDVLGGVVVLTGTGAVRDWQKDDLYRPAGEAKQVPLTAVPYCVWDNRSPGEMQVWIPAI